ncbi:hypothetical protein [Vibrio sinaloensis]|uniref:hypothetical protein n=1 Tax=Photobacterium sp. (strain ATCC 43367) TaxID=379097 RepID=UPI0022AF8FBB|nr:hypothetical protein [Vibrio sinaloensis]MCZ4295113.1 hypothetical protein [Vibrio sinaloensis]
MEIALNKQAMDKLMPLCRKYEISPRWAFIQLVSLPDFEKHLLAAMELDNDNTSPTQDC